MDRRGLWATLAMPAGATLLSAAAAACQGGGDQAARLSAGTPAKQDVKTIAARLQAKTAALIDAITSKNPEAIARAKSDLAKEADTAEDALQSETGQTANQVNSAVSNIRAGMTNNDVNRLTRARDQLQQAQQ
jgi:hypothetical protein